MRAAVVTRFGGPEVLVSRELPEPEPGRGEVAIDVTAADVLWVETVIRQGLAGDHFDAAPPYVPGNGVAGRIRAVGDGVDPSWCGGEVLSFARSILATRGGVSASELAAAREAGLGDAELSEIVGHVAVNVLTNYFNRAFGVDVDFPVVEPEGVAVA